MIIQHEITLPEFRPGFHHITNLIVEKLGPMPAIGLLNIHLKHTSAALTMNENADPSVRSDFRTFFDELVPKSYPRFSHTLEGEDDMPAHIKSSMLGGSLTIPITSGRLNMGTWQGIYLCEFRNHGGRRSVVVTIFS